MCSVLKALNILGLDLNSGKSVFISVEDIEEATGKRITGNGSTIRRDVKPYSYFEFENVKIKNKVVGYKFKGYLNKDSEMERLLSQISTTKKRYLLEESKIIQRIEKLNSIKLLDNKCLYSKKDVLKYI